VAPEFPREAYELQGFQGPRALVYAHRRAYNPASSAWIPWF